ncbi:MAG: hypothetical protein ABJD11_04155, partial [Gemmatimonadota bacterium]
MGTGAEWHPVPFGFSRILHITAMHVFSAGAASLILLVAPTNHYRPNSQSQAVSSPVSAPVVVAKADTTAPVVVPPATPKAMRYYRSGIIVWGVGLIGELAVLGLMFWSGLSTRLRDFADARTRRWYPRLALYTALFAGLLFVLSLPYAFYAGFVREHAFGISNQTLEKWTRDTIIGVLLSTGVAALILVPMLYRLLKRTRRWWLVLALLSVPFGLFTQVIAPLWIAPLFNHFEPLQDKALESQILAVAGRAGIGGARIFQ